MKDYVRGVIVGVAIGDALGMPAESLSPVSVQKHYGNINTYRTPRRHSFHKLKRGQWTDDTQLTLAIGESIIKMKGINFEDIADAHISAFNSSRRGWGKTTIQGCQKLIMGCDWWDAGGNSGAGNGPPMKIAPVGVLYGLGIINLTELIATCVNISKMTHGDVRAGVAAVVQAYLVGKAIMNDEPYNLMCEISEVYKLARRIEDFSEDSLTGKLELMPMIKGLKYDKQIRDIFGAGAFVNESLPFTYSIILKYQGNIEKCLEALVNMGGDSDTNASMAGAILGAFHGYKAFPQKWRRGLEDRKRLIKLADDLYDLGS